MKKAFTSIECLILFLMLGVLVAMIFPLFKNIQKHHGQMEIYQDSTTKPCGDMK